MSILKCFAISCSSDIVLGAKSLYVWGSIRSARWLPESIAEARKRIRHCKNETGCSCCDAEIHEITIKRSLMTNRQLTSKHPKD